MRCIFLCILAFVSITAEASPCDGVERALSPGQRQVLEGQLAKQLSVEKIQVLNTFKYKRWSIIYVETFVSDEPFLFYSADPMKNGYVALWAGAAASAEEHDIKNWVMKNVPGIPAKLANCFVWYVIKTPRK